MPKEQKQTFARRALAALVAASITSCTALPNLSVVSPVLSAVTPSGAVCESFNQGDPLDERIGSGDLSLKVPVDRRDASRRSVVIIPGNGPSQTFWAYRAANGWFFADKQTVGIATDGLLDLQPMHRIDSRVYPNMVQVIVLSQDRRQRKITLQPVLEGSTSRWGKRITFPVRISVQGQVHAFRGIERGISGNAIPSYLNRVLDQLEPGSVYIPQNIQIEVIEPTIANPQICPVSRSAFPTH